jgi:hypothetical protein
LATQAPQPTAVWARLTASRESDPAGEVLRFHRRDGVHDLVFGKDLRRAQPQFAGEAVVHLHPDAVEGAFPPFVVGNNEGHVVDEVRGVAVQKAALAQGLEDEGDVALLQVAHAAVHQFGAAAGGPLAEVVLLDKEDAVAPRGGVDGGAESGGAPADNDHVEGIGLVADLV